MASFAKAARFADRTDAGRRLARAVARLRLGAPLVLALPRGGVPVAFEVARRLKAPLDVLIVRKLGAPGNPELAIGAVVDGDHRQVVVDDTVMAMTGASADYVKAETDRQVAEIERRRRAYFGDRQPTVVAGRNVVLVDDGIATGATARVALRALRAAGAARRVLAVPVAPPDMLGALRQEADEVVCLATPSPFLAVGYHYDLFEQTSDEEVTRLLAAARATAGK